MNQVVKKEYTTLIAPDGHVQFAMMSESESSMIDIINYLHSWGIMKSLNEQLSDGSRIAKVEVTILEKK